MDNKSLYLDYAATCLRVPEIYDKTREFALHHYANIGRGSYELAEEAMLAYKLSKKTVAEWIGCEPAEVLYTYSATYAINILVLALEHNQILHAGDTVLLSVTEHHANIVPWQMLSKRIGINVKFVLIDEDYRIDLEDLKTKIDETVKVVSLQYASNVTGAIHPMEAIRKIIGDRLFFIDATQMSLHGPSDMKAIGCDALVFSGHKIHADTGIGVLALRKDLQKSWQSPIGGGGAVNFVAQETYEQAGIPERWEPGTPNIIGAVSLIHSIEYIRTHVHLETQYQSLIPWLNTQFSSLQIPGLQIFHSLYASMLSVWSFAISGKHHLDIADSLAEHGICVRAGHHCCQPLHTILGVPGTIRVSCGLHTTKQDLEHFLKILPVIVT